jgi:peptidoglycan/LPS O-acetylase OafA/YrhL
VAATVLAGMAVAAMLLPIYGLTAQEGMRLVICGVPAMLLVYAVLSLDAQGWRPPRVALWLGEISYSLYMWHIVVLMILAVVTRGWLDSAPTPLLYWALALVLSIVVARAAHQFIEVPPTRLANRLTRGKRA